MTQTQNSVYSALLYGAPQVTKFKEKVIRQIKKGKGPQTSDITNNILSEGQNKVVNVAILLIVLQKFLLLRFLHFLLIHISDYTPVVPS